jgi:leucine dehydrogenase
MWVYQDTRAALRDVLRLSRAMTYKAAVANLPLGGGKGVIMVPVNGSLERKRRHDALLDFGDTVEGHGGA